MHASVLVVTDFHINNYRPDVCWLIEEKLTPISYSFVFSQKDFSMSSASTEVQKLLLSY